MEDNKFDLQKISKKLNKYLDEDRMWHTLGVMNVAGSMAMRFGVDLNKALLAGLLHDCAKCIPNKKKLKLCKENNIKVSDFEKTHPFLLHAKIGVWIAQEKYNVYDQEVLDAICWHTTGKPDMTQLEKIIYIADYIEPARNKAPRLEQIRELAFRDLDLCMYEILHDTLNYLGDNSDDLDYTTVQAYEYYKELISQKEENNYE